MKTLFYLSTLSVSIIFTSCKKEINHSFTDEERAFLVYNEGDIFKLKNENTGDTLIFNLISREVNFKDDFGPQLGPKRKSHFMEEGRLRYSNSSGYNSLDYIYLYKDKLDQFTLSISLWLDKNNYGTSVGEIEGITTITSGGIVYQNVYVFSADNNTKCYFSKEYGFVKLEDLDNGLIYSRIP